jgi:hypothetical protein
MKSVGSLVRAYMLHTYEMPSVVDCEIAEDERVMLEGIYMTASVSTCEIMLGMVEVFILAADGIRKRSVAVFTDSYANINMDNVAWIEFVDSDPTLCKNIQKEGLVKIPRVQIP